MKIAEFRRIVGYLNHARRDLTGGTPEEFRRQNIPVRLEPHIKAVTRALEQIAPRFEDDIASATSAIQYANKTIARWNDVQTQPPAPTGGELRAKARLVLVHSSTSIH